MPSVTHMTIVTKMTSDHGEYFDILTNVTNFGENVTSVKISTHMN